MRRPKMRRRASGSFAGDGGRSADGHDGAHGGVNDTFGRLVRLVLSRCALRETRGVEGHSYCVGTASPLREVPVCVWRGAGAGAGAAHWALSGRASRSERVVAAALELPSSLGYLAELEAWGLGRTRIRLERGASRERQIRECIVCGGCLASKC